MDLSENGDRSETSLVLRTAMSGSWEQQRSFPAASERHGYARAELSTVDASRLEADRPERAKDEIAISGGNRVGHRANAGQGQRTCKNGWLKQRMSD